MVLGRISSTVFLISAMSGGTLQAESPKDALHQTMAKLQASQQKAAEISHDMQEAQSQLQQMQRKSGELAAKIRSQQTTVERNREEIVRLRNERRFKKAALESRRGEIAKLLHGMIRLQRLPRQYVAAAPVDTQQLLRTASALDVTYDATHRQFAELNAEFEALASLSEQLESQQHQLTAALQEVQQHQQELTETVQARRQAHRHLQQNHQQVQRRVTELSEKSGDLQELIARLESETMLFKTTALPQPKPAIPTLSVPQFSARKGQLGYPVSGEVLHRFGERRSGGGETYRGIELRTLAGAPVTAPHAGKVVFSGNFMDYGPMVIIQHDKTYHSVIAGLDVVEVEPGQPVNTGELIGSMGRSEPTRKLYFELRKHSKAIDPGAWIGNVRTAKLN